MKNLDDVSNNWYNFRQELGVVFLNKKRVIQFGAFFIAGMLILQSINQSIIQAEDEYIDRTPLHMLVMQTLELDGCDYTNVTWRAFAATLSEAQAALYNSGAEQEEVDDAYAALQAAAAALVSIASFGNPFTDVASDDWFYDAVLYANANALMQSAAAAKFQPLGTLSRAMVVDALYRAEAEPYVTFETVFNDVLVDRWYSSAVIWTANHGIATGVSLDRFAPDEHITREQLATMLRRYAEFKDYDVTVPAAFGLSNFTDNAQVSDWAYEAVRWAVYHELIRGSGGRLSPRGTATRAEYATILQRLIDRFEFGRRLPAGPQFEQYHITWQFVTYLEPNFRAAEQETFYSKTVNVIQRSDDGWAMIATDGGNRWVYLQSNRRYTNRPVYLFNGLNGRRGQRIEPQIVSILQQQDDWHQISTWLGPKWIYLGQGEQPIGLRQIALTFDDGPSVYTVRLLDALYDRNVPATFFVLGRRVEQYPDVAVRIVRDGHEIASHSYRHPVLTRMSANRIRDELFKGRNAIYQAVGIKPTLFRPPYGAHNSVVQAVAAEFGYPIILWSVDTRDWESRNVGAIMSHFIDQNGVRIRDGDIILMHDIYSTTVDAAIKAIDLLLAEGFTFVTVSDLLIEHYGELTPGKVYRWRYISQAASYFS